MKISLWLTPALWCVLALAIGMAGLSLLNVRDNVVVLIGAVATLAGLLVFVTHALTLIRIFWEGRLNRP